MYFFNDRCRVLNALSREKWLLVPSTGKRVLSQNIHQIAICVGSIRAICPLQFASNVDLCIFFNHVQFAG